MPLPVSLQPFAKAVVPFALTVVTVLIHGAFTGEFDAAELEIAVTGIAAAVLAYIVPNTQA